MNNTIVICGGSSGIGYDTAKLFLEKKCNVIISSRNKTKLSEAHKQLAKEYPDGNILCYPADMSNFTDAYLLFEYATTKYSNINTLVNSCGMWSSKSISELNNKDISESFDSNLKSVIVGTIIASQFMQNNYQNKNIINIGSFAGKIPKNNGSLYSCFKSAIINFTQSSAQELIKYAIKVNCVTPGVIDTPMTHDNIAINEKELLKSISMNRIGSSREIANIIYLLTTNYSSYINGANIEVTGGKYLTQI